MDELLAFLPILNAAGFSPVERWEGGNDAPDGSVSAPWPLYRPEVETFFRAVSKDCWIASDYRPDEAARLIEDDQAIRNASLDQIRTMLTYCVRGERFCDGHWAALIEKGYIRRILERLAEIRASFGASLEAVSNPVARQRPLPGKNDRS